jgi:hypothetical protein
MAGVDTLTSGARRFPLAKPLLGRARGGLTIDGPILRVEHRMLKEPLEIPLSDVAAAVHVGADDAEEEELPLPERELRTLVLPSDPRRPSGLLLVLRHPVRIGHFRFSADRVLAISSKERRRGVDVDLLGVQVADVDAARVALGAAGVDTTSSLPTVIREVGGELTDPVAIEARRSAAQRAAGRARLALLVGSWSPVLLAVLTALAHLGVPTSTLLRIVGVGWCWGVAGALVALVAGRAREHGAATGSARRRGRAPIRTRGVLIAMSLVTILSAIAMAEIANSLHLAGPWFVVLVGGLLGVPTGVALVLVTQVVSSLRRGAARQLGPRYELGGAVVVLLAVACVAGLVTTARGEPGSFAQARLAGSALVSGGQLGGTWHQSGSDLVDRGDDLDHHLCGGHATDLPSFDAVVHRRFTRPHEPDGGPGGVVQIGVYLAADEATAAREIALVDGPGYLSCMGAQVAGLLACTPCQIGLPTWSWVMQRSSIASAPDIAAFTARQATTHGMGWVNQSFVRVRVGRAVLRIAATTYGRPIDPDELATIAVTQEHELERALS